MTSPFPSSLAVSRARLLVYVAAPPRLASDVLAIHDELRGLGMLGVATWPLMSLELQLAEPEKTRAAARAIDDNLDSAHVMLVASGYGLDTAVDMGLALGRKIPVVWVREPPPPRFVTDHRDGVAVVASMETAFKRLEFWAALAAELRDLRKFDQAQVRDALWRRLSSGLQ